MKTVRILILLLLLARSGFSQCATCAVCNCNWPTNMTSVVAFVQGMGWCGCTPFYTIYGPSYNNYDVVSLSAVQTLAVGSGGTPDIPLDFFTYNFGTNDDTTDILLLDSTNACKSYYTTNSILSNVTWSVWIGTNGIITGQIDSDWGVLFFGQTYASPCSFPVTIPNDLASCNCGTISNGVTTCVLTPTGFYDLSELGYAFSCCAGSMTVVAGAINQ